MASLACPTSTIQTSAMEIPQLRIEVKPGEGAGRSLVRNLVLGFLDGGPSSTPASKYPEVAVCNSAGKRRVLDVHDTLEEAQDRAAAIEGIFRR